MARESAASLGLRDRVRFVLLGPKGPVNVGLAARGVANMGFARLDLVAPGPMDRDEVLRASSHAAWVVERGRIFRDLGEALEGAAVVAGTTARPRTGRWEPLDPRDLAARFASVPGGDDLVVLFGPEDRGLSNRELDHCTLAVTIPAHPGYPVLNLASAVTLVAYELHRSLPAHGPRAGRRAAPARRGEVEGFFGQARALLSEVGFLDPQNPERAMRVLRRMVDRARPDSRELGMLRAVVARCKVALDRARQGLPVRGMDR